MRLAAFSALSIASILACAAPTDTAAVDTSVMGDADTDTDSDTDTDTDADPVFDVSWDSNGVALAIEGGTGGSYLFGMMEETDGGWGGEDGLDGPCSDYGAQSGNFDVNHDNMADGALLNSATRPEALKANLTTLFNNTIAEAGHIAYMILDENGCWTNNDADGYYAGCN